MVSPSQSFRRNVEQRHAPGFVKRSSLLRRDTTSLPLAGTESLSSFEFTNTPSATPSSTSSASGPPGVTLPPHGAPALISIVLVISLAILGFSAWRVWVYRSNKKAAGAASSEKSSKPVGLHDAVDEESRSKTTLSVGDGDAIAFPSQTGSKAAMTRERTAAEIKVNLGYRPKVVYAGFEETTTSSPEVRARATSPPLGLRIKPPPLYFSVPPPAVSPRTAASIAPTGKAVPRAAPKHPRLVVVEFTYTPSLHDELRIREGETLQLLEEYEDEWCLVQRVGTEPAERGVVPRFCVVDKPNSAA